jgi:long-chain acyl-CoA synthetase
VKEALVIGIPDTYMGERPKAFVALNDGAAADEAELRDWVNGQIGKHERVAAVAIRPALPKTMIGKLDRKALRLEEGV